jgi:hypothetical protein
MKSIRSARKIIFEGILESTHHFNAIQALSTAMQAT